VVTTASWCDPDAAYDPSHPCPRTTAAATQDVPVKTETVTLGQIVDGLLAGRRKLLHEIPAPTFLSWLELRRAV
jgi:hypothetical protein